jgi:hypothetical protein
LEPTTNTRNLPPARVRCYYPSGFENVLRKQVEVDPVRWTGTGIS